MSPRGRCLHLATVILSCLVSWSYADIFTATFKMERLLDTRQTVINELEVYIQKNVNRLEDLKKYLRLYKSEQEASKKDKLNYVGNPINAFTLIKRLTTDLDYIEKIIKENHNVPEFVHREPQTDEQENNATIILYPTSEDLMGAATALTRLQKTYKVKVKDLARGIISGVIYNLRMTASDCYEMGVYAYQKKDYKSLLAWHMAAYRKIKLEDDVPHSVDEITLMEYIALANYYLSELMAAAEWTARVLTLKPEYKRARLNYITYQKHADGKLSRFTIDIFKPKKQETCGANDRIDKNEVASDTSTSRESHQGFVDKRRSKMMYSSLCRGEFNVAPEISSKLSCRYLNNKPFLKLAPIKMEQLYIDPDVYQFYDVISDEEIEHVKNISRPGFQRAGTVGSPKSDIRISQSSWLNNGDPIVARWTQRVSDFTGLDAYHADDLQVANYGVGGYYDTHFDYFGITHESERIGTNIFYLSNVAQGGATVFPKLGLTVFPRKGAALFWPNLHPSGEGNQNTLHAACPVLEGSKWIANKWIYLKGQEFIRPCTLGYQKQEDIHPKPLPVPKSDTFHDEATKFNY